MARESTIRKADSRRGSVLLLALILTALLGALAAGFAASSGLQRGVGRDLAGELSGDLAAQSGLEFAQRQLALDPAWTGTGPDGIRLPGGGLFVIDATPSEIGRRLLVDGVGADSAARLEAELEVNGPGAGTRDKAVIALGEEVEFEHVQVHGSTLIADQLGAVDDWVNYADGSGAWVGDRRDQLEEFSFGWTMVHEVFFKYLDVVYVGGNTVEEVVAEPVKMPAWNLDSWLQPQPGVVVLTDITGLVNENFDEVVVLVFTHQPPLHRDGAEWSHDVHLTRCHFDRGLVVYCPPTLDVRNAEGWLGYEIEIEAENSHFGSPGGGQLGILAPGAEIELENSTVRGLVFAGEVELELSELWGILIAINELELEHAQVFYDPAVGADPPPGVELSSSPAAVVLRSVRERFE